ncbi:MAG: hypothetical protein OXC95_08190 [Dehalococcoidia bacterium]|nr:hypothetical protein [Dehalococcoidia bacterium]
MPETWEKALKAYTYPESSKLPLDLSKFIDASKYPGWFECRIDNGALSETRAFEDRFRELAPHHLEAWYEVVFWKMYSQSVWSNSTTQTAIANVEKAGVSANDLWTLCHEYMANLDKRAFRDFRNKLFSSGIATVATFPAFI